MEWLIANPNERLGDCAAHFRVSQAWLSTIIHSAAFQQRYRELVAENLDERVLPLRNKLTGVAHAAIEKLGTALDLSTDPDFVLSVADKTLHRLGYAPSKAPATGGTVMGNQINVFTTVSQEALERARQRRRTFYEGETVDAEPAALPTPEEI